MSGLLPALATIETFLDGVHCLDAETLLRSLPSESVNCIVTSPPYYGLRDYGVDGQIGLEETPGLYVERLVGVFREAWRVLRTDGTMWVNLGDSYAGSWGNYHPTGTGGQRVKNSERWKRYAYVDKSFRPPNSIPGPGLKPKDLIGIPWRVALALQADGWYLRSDIIWHKPNPMPESVTDRCSVAHEYVFMLTKSARYWYDADAIRTPLSPKTFTTFGCEHHPQKGDEFVRSKNWADSVAERQPKLTIDGSIAGANKRTVWTIASEPTPFAHFATFPMKLIEPMILAGCPAQVCSRCGAPWGRHWITLRESSWERRKADGRSAGYTTPSRAQHGQARLSEKADRDAGGFGLPAEKKTVGFRPACECDAPSRPGIVIDPFGGSGTAGLVARQHGRHYILCDLNPEYVALARDRLRRPFEPHHLQQETRYDDLPLFGGTNT